MQTPNVLFANIYDLKDKISSRLWRCCEEHSLNIEFAVNFDDALAKLGEKTYHGLILGNAPDKAGYSGIRIMQKVRELDGYGNMPVVIIIKHPNEFEYDMVEGDTSRLLIVPENELLEAKMIMKIIHEHFLGLNQYNLQLSWVIYYIHLWFHCSND